MVPLTVAKISESVVVVRSLNTILPNSHRTHNTFTPDIRAYAYTYIHTYSTHQACTIIKSKRQHIGIFKRDFLHRIFWHTDNWSQPAVNTQTHTQGLSSGVRLISQNSRSSSCSRPQGVTPTNHLLQGFSTSKSTSTCTTTTTASWLQMTLKTVHMIHANM